MPSRLEGDASPSAEHTRPVDALGEVESEIVERRFQGMKVVSVSRALIGMNRTSGVIAAAEALTRVRVCAFTVRSDDRAPRMIGFKRSFKDELDSVVSPLDEDALV